MTNLIKAVNQQNTPAALESLWCQVRTLSQMQLSPKLRTGIALWVAQLSGCKYCVAAVKRLA